MREPYLPTPEDIQRAKPTPDKIKVSGDGVFATFQGEGVTAGQPAVFLRLQYCNLACGSSSGWKCDTGYTWDKNTAEYWQEPEDWGYQESADRITQAWNQRFGGDTNAPKRLVITGGEPMLQQKKIVGILSNIPEWKVEIETNGTIPPIPELFNCQFNCSPKLENSGNSQRSRYRPEVIKLINSLSNSWFKFVVVEPGDLEGIDRIVRECGIDASKVLIMPEGQTAEEVSAHSQAVQQESDMRNWQVIQRNHLIWFGPKRRT